MTNVNEILAAKSSAGNDAFLWLYVFGDCILWSSENASVNDDGALAVNRWQVFIVVADDLINSGEVDEEFA